MGLRRRAERTGSHSRRPASPAAAKERRALTSQPLPTRWRNCLGLLTRRPRAGSSVRMRCFWRLILTSCRLLR
jgi:hypothetical protein